ncbi:pimeloyl-ACP methyl ester carboxylesterase [Nonomuraea thailandensis]|uniref:Pimeloyl-ACP methyl ester carboxylesterase n=1 Tax=Nonomuraea thailandensis TaxID=1188745 RepID=A0A9X2K6L8_9ACTN|nr:prolyl oligopeptidase family serine peptidase [Nonomuraea thailandensis]MCP2361614.1 pimeloyl-ACP methyl ester carboxylesterase [Nonomuraea thailandensis]
MRRILAAIAAVLFVLATPAHATAPPGPPEPQGLPGDLTSTEVSFRGDGNLELRGSVISAAGAPDGRPGVVLVHGAGTGTRREKLLAEAVAFARQGLSVLVYDKRSVGYSLFERSYPQLAEDALAAVGTLRRQPGVDPAKVGIWGLSEGGWVAPIAAARSSDIAFVILVGANALEPLRQQAWAVAAGLRKAGVGGSLVDRAEPNLYRVIADGGLFPEPYHDPAPVLAKVRQPVLGIWGVHDLLTPPRETPPILAEALEDGGNRRYAFRFFAGADHAAHLTPDGGVTRQPELAPGYAELVGTWVGEATSGRAPEAQVTGPAPVQASDTFGVPPTAWWESAPVQAVALVLLLVAFGGYPVAALVRKVRRRPAVTPVRAARLVSAGGLLAALGGFAYLFYVIMTGGKLSVPGPMAGDRPIIWLALQAVAAVTVAATAVTAARWRRAATRGERVRLGLLVAGGVVFAPWALYWGLLLP